MPVASGAGGGIGGGSTTVAAGGGRPSPPVPNTRYLFFGGLLELIHAPVTQNNIDALGAQSIFEYGTSSDNVDHFNPLATTQPYGSSVSTNSAGVQSYNSFQDGLQATADTLLNGDYDAYVSSLRANNPPEVSMSAVSNSPWGSHPVAEDLSQVNNAYLSAPVSGGGYVPGGLANAIIGQGDASLTQWLQSAVGSSTGGIVSTVEAPFNWLGGQLSSFQTAIFRWLMLAGGIVVALFGIFLLVKGMGGIPNVVPV